jgi:phosphatidylinositol alpha-1,6-mannosyltransferase
MTKVAYVLPTLRKGTGWRSHARAFLGGIRAHVEPVLFVAAADLAEAKALFPDLKLFSLPTTQEFSLAGLRGPFKLASCYAAIRWGHYPEVDLVHSLEAYPTGLVGSWLAKKLDRPHVITTQGTYGLIWHRQITNRRTYEGVLREADLICPGSNGTADLLKKYFGAALTDTPVKAVLNGNDYHRKIPRQVALDHRIPTIPTLLTVGEVKGRKGHHLSLAAFAKVKKVLPEARYWIVGTYRQNTYFDLLGDFIEQEGLEGVSFMGRVSDQQLQRCYQQASLFVLTPQLTRLRFEGFGLVYLEAGAYGLPVVATRSGGVPDAVVDGETGLLCEEGDVDGIAAAILRLLGDEELARRMGLANRDWAETLTWERTIEEQLKLYEEVL